MKFIKPGHGEGEQGDLQKRNPTEVKTAFGEESCRDIDLRRCDPATTEPWTQLLIFPEGTTSNRQVKSRKMNAPLGQESSPAGPHEL